MLCRSHRLSVALGLVLATERPARLEAALGDALAAGTHQHRLIDDHRLVRRLVDAEVEELAGELLARRGQILAFVEDDAIGAGGDGFGQQALEQALRRPDPLRILDRSEEHTSALQSLLSISYAVFCLKKKKT